MEHIEMLISDLESEVLKAKKAAFSNTDIVINKGVLLDIISRIRASYPIVLKEAAAIVRDRDDILDKAEKYACDTMDAAEAHARQMMSENEVLKKAQAAADEMRAEAEEHYKRLDYDSRRHAYNLLENVEVALKEAMDVVNQSKSNLIES